MASISKHEFVQNVQAAKDAARVGPVFITDQGEPTHVLLSYEAYQRLAGRDRKIADLLALDGDIPLEVPSRGDLPRAAELV